MIGPEKHELEGMEIFGRAAWLLLAVLLSMLLGLAGIYCAVQAQPFAAVALLMLSLLAWLAYREESE